MNIKKIIAVLAVCIAPATHAATSNDAVAQKEIHFYSEGIQCYGKLFVPAGYAAGSKVAAVVLAPGAKQTSASLDAYAREIASQGALAMTFDYRGWGKSGGFLYYGEPMRWDDRMRFSQTTTKMLVRRLRLDPQAQLTDIRNAITYLQGEAGVDRARIGVLGQDLSGGHAIVAAGIDARVKAVVSLVPMLEGKDSQRQAFAPSAEQQAAMVKFARSGAAPTTQAAATARNAEESKLALAEYHPYWYLDQIPQTTAVRFIVAAKDTQTRVAADAAAAAKVLKGTTDVVAIPDAAKLTGSAGEAAARSSAEWFAKNL